MKGTIINPRFHDEELLWNQVFVEKVADLWGEMNEKSYAPVVAFCLVTQNAACPTSIVSQLFVWQQFSVEPVVFPE